MTTSDSYPSGAQNDGMRNAIIDASRDLFAKFGYKKTTMEDIAQAMRKGKSSLYYYFKNKEEIFQAVIEAEETMLFSKLNEVVTSNMDAKDKLRNYVITRMETIHQLENYMKAKKDDSLSNVDFFVKLKLESEKREAGLLMTILDEGSKSNLFQVKNIPMAAVAIATALKGLEAPLFSTVDNFDDFKLQIENILNILFFGIIKR